MSTASSDYQVIPLIETASRTVQWPVVKSSLISSFLNGLAMFASPITSTRETVGLTRDEQAILMKALWASVEIVE
jgi:hypothetical protein